MSSSTRMRCQKRSLAPPSRRSPSLAFAARGWGGFFWGGGASTESPRPVDVPVPSTEEEEDITASSSGAAASVPILRPRGGGLTVDLSAAEVVEIETALDNVIFDDTKYKREAIKNGASVFLGAVRASVSTSTYDNMEVIQVLNGIMKKYADVVGMQHYRQLEHDR